MTARRALSAVVYTALATILVATVGIALRGVMNGDLKALDVWASFVPVVLTVANIVTTVLQGSRGPVVTLDEAVAAEVPVLARKIARDWVEESRHRGLFSERRMAVRWRRRPGSGRVSQLSAELPEEGVLDQLTGAFARHAREGSLSRLVVTGEPGAGKTAVCVLATVELAEPDGPAVPVLFRLSSWNPARPLMDWMTDELTTNYPAFADQTRSHQIAGKLVQHHVLPVLDGLDEVGDPAAALRRIEDELEGRCFILSCRSAEFDRLDAGGLLSEALVVQLQPLRADEARGILETARPEPALEPLTSALDARPDGPLARALETPFMLSLLVALGGSLPGELLSATGPGAEERIKQHLLGACIARAYRRGDLDADEARRHLAFLARNVDSATGRLAWWQLHRAVPRWVYLAVAWFNASICCSAAAIALFALFGRPLLGLWIGLGAALIGAPVVELVPQDDPRRAKPRLRSVRAPSSHALQRVLGFGAMGAAATAVIAWFLYERPQYAVIGGVLTGITYAAARYFSEPSDPMEAVTPTALLRSDRTAVVYAWLAGAVAGALTGAYLGASIKDGRRVPQLDDVTLIDQLPTAVEALMGAAAGALLSATGLGLMAIGSSSWGRFVITRVWLAVRGRTPMRLMAFVEDARERGILRQMNGYYEFRHRLLQRHLAEPASVIASASAADASSISVGSAQ
ncbi:NACHT domain-containing protein [Streptomyces albidus (ex Kaewkla and Franco 2022)]|uniref:NACHT domain-containing protein n=1 Tax=Streptomyces albidus (ex Kaewkla and Franco 2022) TaxID=722709 RepID=UPI0015EEEC75|nr:NACHT domain-containing protein [Streptomyces albidus (ex Kaewkla and Franco 2022)]